MDQFRIFTAIEVICFKFHLEFVQPGQVQGVFVQYRIICFQVNDPVIFQELTVKVQKTSCCKSFFITTPFQLRIRKCQPYLIDFSGTEKGIDNLYPGADEGNIRDLLQVCLLGTCPYPCPLDIDPNKINVRKAFCQANGIFTFPTS